ncbi:MAG: metallophosphoesterase, partial [Zetaproteobacteria bacterium]
GSTSLRIVGSIHEMPFDAAAVAHRLLALPPMPLAHGAAFTGRPITRIHADDRYVLKSRLDRRFADEATAVAWCRQRLTLERRYAVYHPARTWLAFVAEDGRWQAANLSPRLAPLHLLADQGRLSEAALLQIVRMYYRMAGRFGQRLDEGLSNFGLNADGALFYLDDDFFAWDEHASFVAMIGQWLRAYAGQWLGADAARRLGETIARALHDHMGELDVDIVAEGIRDLYLPASAEASRRALLEGLLAGADERPNASLFGRGPVALLADIHANLPALDAVLAELDRRGIRSILVLGDVVGYGPHPEACIMRLQRRNAVVIRGNHDHYVAHRGESKASMSVSAQAAADWTIQRLTDPMREWLAALPLKLADGPRLAVHGAPVDRSYINAYVYEMTYQRNLDALAALEKKICFHGHSHIQGTYGRRRSQHLPLDERPCQELGRLDAALVNPGSVGQPRNGDPRAQAAIYDPARETVEFLRIPYDLAQTIADMQRFGLPEQLVQRLRQGR